MQSAASKAWKRERRDERVVSADHIAVSVHLPCLNRIVVVNGVKSPRPHEIINNGLDFAILVNRPAHKHRLPSIPYPGKAKRTPDEVHLLWSSGLIH